MAEAARLNRRLRGHPGLVSGSIHSHAPELAARWITGDKRRTHQSIQLQPVHAGVLRTLAIISRTSGRQ